MSTRIWLFLLVAVFGTIGGLIYGTASLEIVGHGFSWPVANTAAFVVALVASAVLAAAINAASWACASYLLDPPRSRFRGL